MFAPEPTLDRLPDSTALHIMAYLDILSLVRLSKVSRRFYQLLKDKAAWKHVNLTTLPQPTVRKLKKIIKEKLPTDLHSIKMASNATNTVQKKSPPVVTLDVLDELFVKCPNIRRLSVSNCDLRDLRRVKMGKQECLMLKRPLLQSVSITECLTDTRWLSATEWPNLTSLCLAGTTKTSIVDLRDIVKHSRWIESLVCLDLSGCYQVNDDGVEVLTKLKRLQNLNLSTTNITDISLQTVSRFSCLCSLHVSGVQGLTNSGVQNIPDLPHLTLLDISNLPQVDRDTKIFVKQILHKAKVIF